MGHEGYHHANQIDLPMIGRDTEFGAGGVGLRPSAGEATGALVRPLGAFERLYHRYQQKNPMHFCVVAELAEDLDPSALDAALLAVQHRHPLLNTYIDDHPPSRLGLYRPATVSPIPLTIVDAAAGHTWTELVAGELARPFDTCSAPMIRVVLLRAGPSNPAAIIVTADHAIADGLSARSILRDVFSALNGHELHALPAPPSQEELICRIRDAQPAAAPATNGQPQPTPPQWLAALSTFRRFDGALPHLSAITFDEDLTRRLVARTRVERTTVHCALVSAMTRAIIESGRNEFVRMMSPIEIRSHIGVDDDVCLYITATRTAFTRDQLTDLWDMARIVSDQLAGARSVPELLSSSAATEQFIPVDATTEDAEAFLLAGLSFEAVASNLGVLDMGPPEAVRPVAIWGPAVLGQLQDELNTGICTFNGQLRMLTASHNPLVDYLDRVRHILDAAC
jgi:NRPS condensation-like uncharacterized protein